MSAVDLSIFSTADFDPKAWVNATCVSKPSEETSLEKYLAELEMKLQLLAEDISVSLEDNSKQALLRVPRALGEVERVQAGALHLRGTVNTLTQTLTQAQHTSHASVHLLAKVDQVKVRMECARDTMSEASGLAELMESVEEVFAGTDLKKMAQTLNQMTKGLKVVGLVPEFKSGHERVAALEDRLEAVVTPVLSEALATQNSHKASELCEILVAIGRYSCLERLYTQARLAPLQQLWDSYEDDSGSQGSFVEWLPSFYDRVLYQLEQEARWCGQVFPAHCGSLQVELVGALLERTLPAFLRRLQDTLAEAQALGLEESSDSTVAAAVASSDSLGALMQAHQAAVAFGRDLRQVLVSPSSVPSATPASASTILAVLSLVFSPFEPHKQQYGELERRQLAAEVQALDLSLTADLHSVINRMSVAVSGVATLLSVAVERCLAFTGGTEVNSLLQALDEVVYQFISSLSSLLASLRLQLLPASLCVPPPALSTHSPEKEGADQVEYQVEDQPEEETAEVVQEALLLVGISSSLLAQLGAFEATLRNTLVDLHGRLTNLTRLLQPGDDSGILSTSAAGWEAAYVRMSPNPSKVGQVLGLLESAGDPRFTALPRTAARAATFQEAVHQTVFHTLLATVRRHLKNVSRRPEWSVEESASAFELPTFSAYPKEYVTGVGEYLLTLPQQLETLSLAVSGGSEREEEAEDVAFLASNWLTKVASGAAEMYTEELLKVEHLSDKGAQQVAADLEYLCNVYAALGEMVPAPLATFMQCAMVAKDSFVLMVQQQDSEFDSSVVEVVAKMRSINLE
mmetsp:Transcript_24524/g.33821  ORF Transcript_24524/g.33821 Transcript_24524/m.33821 type:complete len:803 (+) Transcript_24524:165-2573(+)